MSAFFLLIQCPSSSGGGGSFTVNLDSTSKAISSASNLKSVSQIEGGLTVQVTGDRKSVSITDVIRTVNKT